jgi:hypothetical protein
MRAQVIAKKPSKSFIHFFHAQTIALELLTYLRAAGYFQQFWLMPSAPISTSCSYADLFGRENSPNDSALLRGHWTISEEEAVSFQLQEVSLELFIHHLISLAEKATFGHSQSKTKRVNQFEAHTVVDSASFTRLKDEPLPMGTISGSSRRICSHSPWSSAEPGSWIPRRARRGQLPDMHS